ncbi:MAG: exodeoxyribonuclease VII large subunit [Blastocatellia bacterium]|nr:exodeoxyribonuclease VII large subunit [Blastocatellia bacterium]
MQNSLLQSLFDDEERRPMTVSELNAQVRGEVERRFRNVWIEGEIVNFSAASSGHWYFTLHDATSQIRAACFKGTNYRIRFEPFDGLQVRVRGRLTMYEPKGEFQLMVESLEPVGEGARRVAFEQIRAKLGAEGLFDVALKRKLPPFPRRVGVVTSATGAAFFDILNVLTRRARSVSVVLIPTRVQGENAAFEISRAVRLANEYNDGAESAARIDALIVGRGGGSSEDLWAFNEELVARAIRASTIPVISAVGHEIDHTIADLVADLRAATPSAAAEIVAQRETDICSALEKRSDDLLRIMSYRLLEARSRVQRLSMSPVFMETLHQANARLERIASQLSPIRMASKVGDNKTRLGLLSQRADSAARDVVDGKMKDLSIFMAKLDALSPLAVLGRGFAIAENEAGLILRDAGQVETSDLIKVRLAAGSLRAKVTSVEP